MSLDIKNQFDSPVGLIAGNGSLPLEFVHNARQKGLQVVTVAHIGETAGEIEQISSSCKWIKVGQLGKLISFLRKSGVKQAFFAGGICKPKLFSVFNLDFKGFMTMAKVKTYNDDTVLRAIAKEIEKVGIKIFSAGLILENSVIKKGSLTKRALNEEERINAEIGWEAAEGIGKYDIGQTVVVIKKAVVAVEAIEGTDACMFRAAELGGKGGVVVKLTKPAQDRRFDLPAVGINTVLNMHKIGATALVLKAGGAILLKPQEVIDAANLHDIAIEAWDKH